MNTYAQAARAIETAVAKARTAGKPVRYGYFLRSLPDYVLESIAATSAGEKLSASLTILVAMRAGALLDGRRRAKFDPPNDVLAVAARRVYEDALIDSLRRQGFLTRFDPAPDPFGADNTRRIQLSDKGREATGDERAVLDNLCAVCEVI